MSGFYEVTAASGVVAAGDRSTQRHQYGPAGLRVIPPPPAPSRGRRTPTPGVFSTRPTGSLRRHRTHHTHRAQQAHRTYTAWIKVVMGAVDLSISQGLRARGTREGSVRLLRAPWRRGAWSSAEVALALQRYRAKPGSERLSGSVSPTDGPTPHGKQSTAMASATTAWTFSQSSYPSPRHLCRRTSEDLCAYCGVSGAHWGEGRLLGSVGERARKTR
jgi:hypothetical protein